MIAVRKLLPICLLAIALGAAPGAAPAQAAFSITEFDGSWTKNGLPEIQAGAHADVRFDARFPATTNPQAEPIPDGNLQSLTYALPPGLIGNPLGLAVCPESKLVSNPTYGSLISSCSPDSIVGIATAELSYGAVINFPIANLQPGPGAAAAFGFNLFGAIVKIKAFTGEGGRKIFTVTEVPQGLPVVTADAVFWGVPTDESHNEERPGTFGQCGDEVGVSTCAATASRSPVMSLPSDCSAGPLTTDAKANSWQQPDVFSFASFQTHLPDETPVGVSGCEALEFEPTMKVQPTSNEAAAPTGLEVDLSVPQDQNPDSFATAHVKDVVTQLPLGMSVNASQANGVGACSPSQIELLNNNPVTCPDDSKIGSAEVITPLLAEPIKGSVYLAQQGTNPFKSLLALYVVAANPKRGVIVKLAGKVTPDPQTGQLTATFADNPQVPFETLHLRLDGGDRAALVNPPTCGEYTTHAELTSWAQPSVPVPSDSTFAIDQGCGKNAQFTPGFEAGTASPVAGSFSPFALRVTRPDGQPNVAGIETVLPDGLVAKLAGVGLCPDAGASTGNCPGASQVGTVTVAAGAGANPVFVPQPGKAPTAAYLAGPYKGGPYSLVVKVPAQAGPFDLGTVAVRNAIHVDPSTAQVSVTSDPLPQLLQGIPIPYRDIRVNVDRAGFTLNPTSCDPMAVAGTITSAAGAAAKVSDRFQVANCASLGFRPKLKLKVSGPTPRGSYPALRAVLTQPKGQANIGRVSVALPHSEFLAQEHIRTICTRVQYAADACPRGSIYGHARAFTPLLDKPLEGPVYLRSSSHPLPDLVAALHGQIDVDLAGRIDSVHGGIRSSFDLVPDAPVTKFVLEMKGGQKGLLVNSRDICANPGKAAVKMDGQNGKLHDFAPVLANDCNGKAKRKSGKH